jgi:transglutaminase/protease-like cytokinesis protein 3
MCVKVISKSSKTDIKNYNKAASFYEKARKSVKGKSAKNKVKILANYLMKRCSYGHCTSHQHLPSVGVILHKKGVCAGYADTFRYLCRVSGVKCEYITNKDQSHAWNLVKIGSKWYHYDVTWNDTAKSARKYSFMGSNKVNYPHLR